MGMMVQDFQARGLRPNMRRKQALPGTHASCEGRATCPLPLRIPGPGFPAHSWIPCLHSTAPGQLPKPQPDNLAPCLKPAVAP